MTKKHASDSNQEDDDLEPQAAQQSDHTHDIHESSDKDNIYRTCRTCPFTETIPRK